MAGELRRGGIIQLQINGVLHEAKGNFTYGLGTAKRESIVGADAVHGYKETPQAAFIEGEITDNKGIDLNALLIAENATVTLTLANSKVIVLRDAYQVAEGTGNTDEGNVGIRFESKGKGEEIS
jgi:hypothetical protein